MPQSPAWVRVGAAAFAIAMGTLLVAARFQASQDFHHQLALQRNAVVLPLVEVVAARETKLARESSGETDQPAH